MTIHLLIKNSNFKFLNIQKIKILEIEIILVLNLLKQNKFIFIISKKRSVDLYLEDSQLINWFYGIKKHLKETDKKYK